MKTCGLMTFVISWFSVYGHEAEMVQLQPNAYKIYPMYNHRTRMLNFTIIYNLTDIKNVHLHYNYTGGNNLDHQPIDDDNMVKMNETEFQSTWTYSANSVQLGQRDIVFVETELDTEVHQHYKGVKKFRVIHGWKFEFKQAGIWRTYHKEKTQQIITDSLIKCLGRGLSEEDCASVSSSNQHSSSKPPKDFKLDHTHSYTDGDITNRRLVIMAVVLPFVLMLAIICLLVYVICRKKGGGSSTHGSSMSSYETSEEQTANRTAAKDKTEYQPKNAYTTHTIQNIYTAPPRRSNSLPSLDTIERRDVENIFTCTEDEDYYSYVDETGMHVIPYERPIIHVAASSRRANSVRTHKLQKRASQKSIDLNGSMET